MNSPTWSDLNSESIVPPLGSHRKPDIGPVALMVSCKPDFTFIKSQISRPRVVSFFNNTLITPDAGDKGVCIVGPYMGAPYGAMLLESLIARGAKKIVILGWCGAVNTDLNVGDIILADKAIVDEGTSRNYAELDPDLPFGTADKQLSDELFDCFQNSEHFQADSFLVEPLLQGSIPADSDQAESKPANSEPVKFVRQTIWTTDAIYRETPKKVAHFKSLGAGAVEMECSALFNVAKYRKVMVAAALVVSDSVASKDWKPGFRKKRFKQAREAACKTLMTFTRELCENG